MAAATTYTLTGPDPLTVAVGQASGNFSMAADDESTAVVTPSDNGAGGTFTPTTRALNNTTPVTFTYTPAQTTGPITISTTNDGDLTQKLTHPSNEIKKVYAVTLDRPLAKNDFEAIIQGVALEDGLAKVDALGYTDPKDKMQVGVEIHSGKNRIVRRIFEHLKYDVKNLDRVIFAGLTKKNVDRGKWRFLTEKEVRDLKYFKKGK